MPPRLARSGLHSQLRLEDPDGALVKRAQAGEREAFEELVRRHADHLHRVVRRFGLPSDAAQEVTQEAFLRAWRSIGAFKGEARFFTWLYRIGVNDKPEISHTDLVWRSTTRPCRSSNVSVRRPRRRS